LAGSSDDSLTATARAAHFPGWPPPASPSARARSSQEIAGAGAVGGGRAYGVCRCVGAESEGAERCTFSQALGQARVVCGDGYALTVRARFRLGW